MTKPSEKKWRALVRVIALEDNGAWITIPGWNPRVALFVESSDVPDEIGKLEIDRRLHVMCNIGCENPNLLEFADWESR